MAIETTPPNADDEEAAPDAATQTLSQHAAAPPDAQETACSACLTQGLAAIGIKAPADATIDFGAIDSDALCAAMAHAIEQCLSGKGFNVTPLTASFQDLRANGKRLTIPALTKALVELSFPAGGTA